MKARLSESMQKARQLNASQVKPMLGGRA